jgi:tight adherence protein B
MIQLLVILIALTVTALAWGLFHLIDGLGEGRKRKLHQRLSSEFKASRSAASSRTILLQATPTGLPPFLSRLAPIKKLQRRLESAFPRLTTAGFLLIDAVLCFSAFCATTMMSGSQLMGLIVGAVGAYLPFLLLSMRRSSLQRRLGMQLPEALDFLARVLRAGQSFSTGIQMISDELPQPLAGEFRRCYDQHSLGQTLEDGLREMAVRLESADFAFFVTAVVIQRQSGGDMSEVLDKISMMIRQRLRLTQAVRAKTSEGRFTGYIMVVFPVVMFVVAWFLNPTYGGLLLHSHSGRMLLGVAVVLEVVGMLLMKRITTVKV